MFSEWGVPSRNYNALNANSRSSRTPSIIDGLAPEKERENRRQGRKFHPTSRDNAQITTNHPRHGLTLPPPFYIRHPIQTFHNYSMAATCLFLAYKVEECVRKMRELVIACVRVAQKDPHKMVDEQKCMHDLHDDTSLRGSWSFTPLTTLHTLLALFYTQAFDPLRCDPTYGYLPRDKIP